MTTMLRTLTTCTHDTCTGHLGKFSSCLDEAVWTLTLEGFGLSTGDTEYEGHLSVVVIDWPEPVEISDGSTLVAPVGFYLVDQCSNGFVYVSKVDTEAEAMDAYEDREWRYLEWLDDEG